MLCLTYLQTAEYSIYAKNQFKWACSRSNIMWGGINLCYYSYLHLIRDTKKKYIMWANSCALTKTKVLHICKLSVLLSLSQLNAISHNPPNAFLRHSFCCCCYLAITFPLVSCPGVIMPGWIIKPNANVTHNYEGIREIAPTKSSQKGAESSESQKIAKR